MSKDTYTRSLPVEMRRERLEFVVRTYLNTIRELEAGNAEAAKQAQLERYLMSQLVDADDE